MSMDRAAARILVAGLAISAWLILLLAGYAAGGAVHLLLGAALVLLFRTPRPR